MISIAIDKYIIWCSLEDDISKYDHYIGYARLVDNFAPANGFEKDDIGIFLVEVYESNEEQPFLVIFQHYNHPGVFFPGIAIVSETKILFIGAGSRLLAYDLSCAKRLWEDTTQIGFHRWRRHGNWIIMSAELELAVWDIYGQKRWSTFVEPPWSYSVNGDWLHLDVMGNTSSFLLSR